MRSETVMCPACGASMEEAEARDVRIDRCRGCGGIWFDTGEFAYLAACQVPPLVVKRPSTRTCPRCRQLMRLALLGPVVVDWCDACHGLFLDAGEMEEIRKGRPPLAGQPVPHWEGQDEEGAADAAGLAVVEALWVLLLAK